MNLKMYKVDYIWDSVISVRLAACTLDVDIPNAYWALHLSTYLTVIIMVLLMSTIQNALEIIVISNQVYSV